MDVESSDLFILRSKSFDRWIGALCLLPIVHIGESWSQFSLVKLILTWLFGCLVGWLVVWLLGGLLGWLVGWLVGGLLGWLVDGCLNSFTLVRAVKLILAFTARNLFRLLSIGHTVKKVGIFGQSQSWM